MEVKKKSSYNLRSKDELLLRYNTFINRIL